MADAAELAVLTATRPVIEVLVAAMLLLVAFAAFTVAAFDVGTAAGWTVVGALATAYAAAAIRLQRALSPNSPQVETARRLSQDVVVSRDGEYQLTPAGRAKVVAYRAQLVPDASHANER